MGGSAFTVGSDPLDTPRMQPDIYEAVKARCSAKLQDLFICVASPIEGPGKSDFGDIDILVAWPKYPFSDKAAALDAVKNMLNARKAILNMGETSANFAIPWPADGQSQSSGSKYIQVDVRICDSIQSLQWILFKHAHGDIWNILGSMIRPYGLTVDEEAFYIRVPEIENTNRKRARVRLTAEPVEILHFLGLPLSQCWEQPFRSRQEMFEYAAQCRLFWVRPAQPEDPLHNLEGAVVDGGTVRDCTELKSNDRRRMNQRSCFRAWMDDFVAECRRQGLYSVKPTTRETVTEEALDAFQVRGEFDRRRNEFLRERQKDHIVKMIKAAAKEADPGDPRAISYRSCQVKALKRIIFEDDLRYGITAARDTLLDGNGFYVEAGVRAFLERHGDEVGDVAFARHEESYMERKRTIVTEE